ncbi:hypothetical protein MTP03_45050 [Tsukamurella sp. PLM1]|nr:hypothetical protein MTP03_45050 [Tsukamurella sp. PLM1]
MDVHRLRILRELADRGTVAATARAMAMTPSAVSQQLKVLAREAGVELLEPDGRRVRLTDAGLALVVRAESVLGELDRARAEMDRYRSTPTGTVRLTLFPSAAELLLPGVLLRTAAAGIAVTASDADLPGTDLPVMMADADVVVAHRDERAAPLGGRGSRRGSSCASRSTSRCRSITRSRRPDASRRLSCRTWTGSA